MKQKVFFCAIIFVILAIPQNVKAYDITDVAPTGQTLYYNIINGYYLSVTTQMNSSPYYLTLPSGALTIPTTIARWGNTYTVISIEDNAFRECNGLTSVTIPNSVTSIGNYAFSGCTNLTSVTIPNTVTSIGRGAFSDCHRMTSMVIPNHITSIADSTFYLCRSLISVTIPNSVSSIGYSAFSGCNSLTTLTIPNSVTSISHYAFNWCCRLPSVTIPNSVNWIGYYAFRHCDSLTTVTIPGSVTSIGYGAFASCISLTSIEVENSNTMYDSRESCNAIINTGTNELIAGCMNSTIPSTVTSIGHYAFSDCIGLTTLTIPDSVTSIGHAAFNGCSSLTGSFIIPNSVTSIDNYAFYRCSGLTSMTIGNAVTTIGNYVFCYDSNLTEINCLGSVAPTLGDVVFYDVSPSIPVYIPCGSLASYQSEWDHFSNFIEPNNPYTLDVYASDETMGHSTVTTPNCETNAVIEAMANYGYHFEHWNDGNTNNPRSVTLTQDTSFTAYFAPNQYTLTVTTGEHGSASGSGTYYYGDTITIRAYPEEHYHFTRWNDGNTDNPRRYRVEGDNTLTAYFAIDTYTVNVVSNDTTRGMVESSGTEFVYGTPCTVTATAYSGYFFAGWSNGANENPYTFAVLSDVELTALFATGGEAIYTVTVVSANPVMGSVSGGGRALRGGKLTIRAIPNEGFQFLAWNDGNTKNPRVVTVTKNITYTAHFIRTTQSISTIDPNDIKIYSTDGRIVVRGAEGMEMRVFDVVGREVVRPTRSGETPILPRGVYLVKVGTLPARKVVVIR